MDYYQQLDQKGFFVIEQALSPELCSELLGYIIASFAKTKPDFILEPNFRAHTPLELIPLTSTAITQVVQQGYPSLDRFLSGAQRLVECSSITVFPHAKAQNIHPDEQNSGKNLISVFVNLAPTTQASGALRIIPGSHKHLSDLAPKGSPDILELPLGSAVFMNSKTWHGGGANRTVDTIRPVFYFSFGEPYLKGPTYSILPEVFDLVKSLKDFRGTAQRSWSAESRPVLPRGALIASTVGLDGVPMLLLISHGKVIRRVTLSPESPWIQTIIALVTQSPGQLALADIQTKVGIDINWLIQFFAYYDQEGWFRPL